MGERPELWILPGLRAYLWSMPNLRRLLVLGTLASCHKPDPRVAEARMELASFATSIRTFHDQKGRWPPNLIAAVGEICLGENHACVSDQGKRLDPWGSPYEYDQSLNSALVRSPGPDRLLGNRDDLEVFVPGK